MKKLFVILLVFATLFTVSVFAAEQTDTNKANALYSLGLVKGYDDSGSDFRLENTLTRAESIVQIVRFLGAEQAALDGEYTLPFTDVPDWAVPYVGYAYENKITSGISATEFGTNSIVSEAQFLTLLLRAMEYSDASGDFTWSEPFAFAKSVGLIDRESGKDTFLRGDAFDACFSALSSKTKSGSTVADKLIAGEAITEKSLGYAQKIATGETITVACVGDSITEGYGASDKSKYSYPAQLQKLLGQGFKVLNYGKSSSYVMNLDSAFNVKSGSPELWYPNTAEYSRLMRSNADIVIVMLGTNDARSMTERAAEVDFTASYKKLISDIQGMESSPDIYLSTMITAVNSFQTNQGTEKVLPRLLRDIAAEMELPLIETGENLNNFFRTDLYYKDMVHPTDISYPALAINFYNEVFGHTKANLEFQKSETGVVYVSNNGKRDNDGKTPESAVDTLGLAVNMLRESGGTVVVCGPLKVNASFLPACAEKVTVTSVYGGVDYRTEKNAYMLIKAGIVLFSDLAIENVNMTVDVNGQAITAQYNNLTIGEGVNVTGSYDLAINGGYRIACGALTSNEVSCFEDCRVEVKSGRWALLRGGNMRGTAKDPIGNITAGVNLTISISGGEFTNTGVNSNSAVGMNSSEGNVIFEISGGVFAGNTYFVHRLAGNQTSRNPSYSGNMTAIITGGTFAKNMGLFQTTDAVLTREKSTLQITEEMKQFVNVNEFDNVIIID